MVDPCQTLRRQCPLTVAIAYTKQVADMATSNSGEAISDQEDDLPPFESRLRLIEESLSAGLFHCHQYICFSVFAASPIPQGPDRFRVDAAPDAAVTEFSELLDEATGHFERKEFDDPFFQAMCDKAVPRFVAICMRRASVCLLILIFLKDSF